MGQEIKSAQFSQSDFAEFQERLQQETKILSQWFHDEVFAQERCCCGFELEGWILDQNQLPASVSESLLKSMNDPHIVPELSRFNFEFNSNPYSVSELLLSELREELENFLDTTRRHAKALNCDITTIGILPTLTKKMLAKKNLHPNKRYQALNQQLKKMRTGSPISIDVRGKEHLNLTHQNVLIETVSTSLQIHLQMEASKAVRYYNAGVILAAPIVAITSNSPFLFGKSLWEETRIPIFEQMAAVPYTYYEEDQPINRVTLGSEYVKDSILELFLENLHFGVLLPEVSPNSKNPLQHLRLHNGTIWRWNRPLIDVSPQGIPHIRLEHRVIAAGTSPTDIIANIAFFLGLIHYYANILDPPEKTLGFVDAKANFYKAACFGLDAQVNWVDKSGIVLQDLLLNHLLPQAKQGLEQLDIPSHDINFYMDDIIKNRIKSKQTGSAWQQSFIHEHGTDFQELMFQYQALQQKDLPVHIWKI